jgi:hypothetical protein
MLDPFFKQVSEAPKQYCNFKNENGLLHISDRGQKLLCIPAGIMLHGCTLCEIIISEAHSLLAHLGASKMVTYLKDHIWWPKMTQDVMSFCTSCETCARSKPSNQKPYGLLNPLDIPTYLWEAIGIDFIGPLPESKDRDGSYNSITMVIDLLTAMVHLIPSRIDYTSLQVAELAFAEVYKHHVLPLSIVSDWDSLFMANFWQELHKLIRVDIQMSTAYHLQTDRAMEWANRTITQMVRNSIVIQDWFTPRTEATGSTPNLSCISTLETHSKWRQVVSGTTS